MKRRALPARLTLPSGQVVALRARGEARALAREEGAPLFSEVDRVLGEQGTVVLTAVDDAAPLDVDALPVPDFHVLRALLTKYGHLAEAPVDVPCTNCGETFVAAPCAELEDGPWLHGELDDPELDALVPPGEPVPFDPPLRLGRVRTARDAVLRPTTVADARPLFRPRADGAPRFDAALVRAMGLDALGPDRAPERIARALEAADDDALDRVVDLVLEARYPRRLTVLVVCPGCGARSPVDAPFERELVGDAPLAVGHEGAPFVPFEVFAARAEALAEPRLAAAPGAPVELVVSEGPADVDDGGEALLGAYVPPSDGGFGALAHPARITLYYRTFRTLWEETPAGAEAFDWEGELDETLEHELEHHGYFLAGHDPMDEQEREAIAEEHARVVGRRALAEREARAFGASLVDFVRRAWPALAIFAAAAALSWCGS